MVLMDLEMPVMGGVSCVKRIRELQEEGRITGHVPVIAVMANARKYQIVECLDAGMVSLAPSFASFSLVPYPRRHCFVHLLTGNLSGV